MSRPPTPRPTRTVAPPKEYKTFAQRAYAENGNRMRPRNIEVVAGTSAIGVPYDVQHAAAVAGKLGLALRAAKAIRLGARAYTKK